MEECRFHIGDVVQHFKRENVNLETAEYLYRILAFAQHTENDERLVIYQALYPPYKTCARPYDMFCSEVDREKYPNAKQKYRFEVVPVDFWPKMCIRDRAKYDLRNFSRELNDVNMACNLNIDTGDFLSFADYFFDGFVVDWVVQDRINNAKRQVEEAIRRIESIVNQLQRM